MIDSNRMLVYGKYCTRKPLGNYLGKKRKVEAASKSNVRFSGRHFHEAGGREITASSVEYRVVYDTLPCLSPPNSTAGSSCIGISSQILVLWRQVFRWFADAYLIHDIGPDQFIETPRI